MKFKEVYFETKMKSISCRRADHSVNNAVGLEGLRIVPGGETELNDQNMTRFAAHYPMHSWLLKGEVEARGLAVGWLSSP